MNILSLSDYKTGLEDQHTITSVVDSKPHDLIIEREYNDGRPNYEWLYSQSETPAAWWCIDAHTNLLDHVTYAKHFDYVFCAQSWFVPLIQREIRGEAFYLPLCHSQTIEDLRETHTAFSGLHRDLPYTFVGNIRSSHVDRNRLVTLLKSHFGDEFLACSDTPEETLKLLRQSLTTFNCSINNDLNFRVFEALAMGASLITDDVPDVNHIQGLRQRITCYKKMSNLNYTTQQQDFSSTYRWIKKYHTITQRYRSMLRMIETGVQDEF